MHKHRIYNQTIYICIDNVWSFSIAFDGANVSGTNYLDVRVRFYAGNDIQNLHLIALPIEKKLKHTGENQCDIICQLFNALLPRKDDAGVYHWQKKLTGITTDGASNMTGRVKGVVTLLYNKCITGSKIYRVWCGVHQLDLVIKKKY